jgi:hypothetical protein
MLTLNVNELENLSDAQEGDKLEFYYMGNGNHAYSNREVTVLEILRNGIIGSDTKFGGTKRFNDCDASDIEVVNADPPIIPFLETFNVPAAIDGGNLNLPKDCVWLNFVEMQNALRVSLPSVLVDSFNESQAADA